MDERNFYIEFRYILIDILNDLHKKIYIKNLSEKNYYDITKKLKNIQNFINGDEKLRKKVSDYINWMINKLEKDEDEHIYKFLYDDINNFLAYKS